LSDILYNTEYLIHWVCRNCPSAHDLHKLDNWSIANYIHDPKPKPKVIH